MMILKGESGKSRVVDIILDGTNSVCFVYNDYALFENSIWLDSRIYTLEHLKLCIVQEIVKYEDYDYLLVYTNQNEEDLQKIIDWLEKYKFNIPCRDIVLTCK